MESNIHLIQLSFQALGLLINIQKSTLIPLQRIEFIRVVLDSIQARALLLGDWFGVITTLIKVPQGPSRYNSAELSESLVPHSIMQHARLCLRSLQAWLATVYLLVLHHLDSTVTVPSQVLVSMEWWLDHHVVCAGVPLLQSQLSMLVVSDTLSPGWGTQLRSLRIQHLWFPKEHSPYQHQRT